MYLSLYRKWRPLKFDDVISQEHIIKTLKNEIKNKKIAHAYLFTGPRGTGKTTCAKIFAKTINCLNTKEGEPCLDCSICKGCENDAVMDIVEMDGASNNSVNDIRTLIEEASFNPAVCKFRVYIIDEVHMLSQSAFNALLKIMEEPPHHVVFILATTEIAKVPLTIISRCQRFDFHRIKAQDISKRLLFVSKHENFELDEDASKLISRLCDGALRDALSLLDQAASLDKNITSSTISNIVGLVSEEYIFKIHKAIALNRPGDVLTLINDLYNSSYDIQTICEQLTSFYRYVMIFKTVNNNNADFNTFNDYAKEAVDDLTLTRVVYILNALLSVSSALKSSINPKLDLEVCLVKLAVPKEDNKPNRLNGLPKKESQFTKNSSLELSKADNENHENKDLNTIKEPLSSTKQSKHNEVEKLQFFDKWNEAIKMLKDDYKDFMCAGFLKDANVILEENKIVIKMNNDIMLTKVLKKKKLLEDIIFKITNKKYTIELMNDNDNIKDNIIDNLLDTAKKMGVDIIVE